MRNENMQQSGFGEVSVVSADVIKKLRHRKHSYFQLTTGGNISKSGPVNLCRKRRNMSKGHDSLFASAC